MRALLVSPPDIPWTAGSAPCDGSSCTLFDQIYGYSFASVVNTPLVIGSAEFTITAPGLVFADFDPSFFEFFGAPLPPGDLRYLPDSGARDGEPARARAPRARNGLTT